MAGRPAASGLGPQQAVRGVPPSQPRCVSSPLPLGLHRMIRTGPRKHGFLRVGSVCEARSGWPGTGWPGSGSFLSTSREHGPHLLRPGQRCKPSAPLPGEPKTVPPTWVKPLWSSHHAAPGKGHPCGHHITLGSCPSPWGHCGGFRAIGLVNGHLLQKLMILTP